MVVVQWLMDCQGPQRVSSISMASLEVTDLFEANNCGCLCCLQPTLRSQLGSMDAKGEG